jgi:hypothetical protein
MASIAHFIFCMLSTTGSGTESFPFAAASLRPALEGIYMDVRSAVTGPAAELERAREAGALVPVMIETQAPFGELVLTGWKRGPTGGSGIFERESLSPLYDDRTWTTTTGFGEMQVPPESTIVFRKHLHLDAAQQAKMKLARIFLSQIDDKGEIYVNGWKVGESGHYTENSTLSINSLLRVGDNVIAVVVTNGGTIGHMARECRILP